MGSRSPTRSRYRYPKRTLKQQSPECDHQQVGIDSISVVSERAGESASGTATGATHCVTIGTAFWRPDGLRNDDLVRSQATLTVVVITFHRVQLLIAEPIAALSQQRHFGDVHQKLNGELKRDHRACLTSSLWHEWQTFEGAVPNSEFATTSPGIAVPVFLGKHRPVGAKRWLERQLRAV